MIYRILSLWPSIIVLIFKKLITENFPNEP